mgnify:CR=1 FL=1
MSEFLLEGLARRVKNIAMEVFSVAGISSRKVSRIEDGVIVDLFPACSLRSKPFRLMMKKNEIYFFYVLPQASEIKQYVNVLLENLMGSNNIDGMSFEPFFDEEDNLNFKFMINSGIPISSFEKLVKQVFKFIKEIQEAVQMRFPEYSLKHFGSIVVSFLGKSYTFIPKKLSDVLEDLKNTWLPFEIITLPDSDGKFLLSSTGIDYLNIPILSAFRENSNSRECYIYVPTEKDPPELKPVGIGDLSSRVMEIIKKSLNVIPDERKQEIEEIKKALKIDTVHAIKELLHKLSSILLECLYINANDAGKEKTVSLRINPSPSLVGNENSFKENKIVDVQSIDVIKKALNELRNLAKDLSIAENLSTEIRNIAIARELLKYIILNNEDLTRLELISGKIIKTKEKTFKTSASRGLHINLKELGLNTRIKKAVINVVEIDNNEHVVVIRFR